MEQVKLGIIGVGNQGCSHIRKILKGLTPEIKLVSVADIKEDRRVWAKENLPEGIKVYNSGSELINSNSVDAVLIAVPHYSHPQLAIEAFQAHLHVMCEKPAGVYTRQVREMNAAADQTDVTFGMMFNQRTNPLYIKMHEIVQSREYGDIMRVTWIITNWFRTQSYYDSGDWRGTWDGEGGGVLLNQCPHQLDLLQWICGMPLAITAHCENGKWHNIECEDDVTAYLEYANGATGVFITSTGEAPGTNRFEISMEKGKLVCENNKLKLYKTDVNVREFCKNAPGGFDTPKFTEEEIVIEGDNPQHVGVLNAFSGNILHGTPLIAKGQEGINGLSISNAMHLSSWLGKKVTIPVDEDTFLAELNKHRGASKKKDTVKEATFDTEGTY